MDKAEWETRVDLAAAFRLVDLYGWSDLLGTHLTARVPGNNQNFLINPFGLMFDEMTASALVSVDINGNILSETNYPINPAGFTIHSAIHMMRHDVECVIHTHTAAGLGVATQEGGLLPLTQQSLAVMAHCGYHDYEGIAFDLSERRTMGNDLGANNVLFLRNHGLISVGASIGEAFMWMYRTERACRFQLAFQSTGAVPSLISSEIIASTFEQNRYANSSKGYRPIGLNEWPALLRKLDRENPGYAK